MRLHGFLTACLLSIATVATLATFAGAVEKPIPQAPYYYVLDEPHVLSPKALHSLETLLIEHDRIAGEQVLVAVFQNLGGEDLVDYTHRVFAAWKIGKRGKDNGVLLALYWDDHKARIEVGYGLEPELTDAKSSQILSEVLLPELKNSNPDRGISLASLEILTVLGSPLIQSGKAEEILKSGGFQGDWKANSEYSQSSGGSFVWLLLGFIILTTVLRALTTAEAHFTRAGWVRHNPWIPYRRSALSGAGFVTGLLTGLGGGGFGGGGGGGGFGGYSGGGGSSGGGGASGGW